MPVVARALAVTSLARMDGMVSVVLVISVDIEVAHPGPCVEPKDGFLDLNSESFLKMRFMSLMIKVKENIPLRVCYCLQSFPAHHYFHHLALA